MGGVLLAIGAGWAAPFLKALAGCGPAETFNRPNFVCLGSTHLKGTGLLILCFGSGNLGGPSMASKYPEKQQAIPDSHTEKGPVAFVWARS